MSSGQTPPPHPTAPPPRPFPNRWWDDAILEGEIHRWERLERISRYCVACSVLLALFVTVIWIVTTYKHYALFSSTST